MVCDASGEVDYAWRTCFLDVSGEHLVGCSTTSLLIAVITVDSALSISSDDSGGWVVSWMAWFSTLCLCSDDVGCAYRDSTDVCDGMAATV